MMADPSRLAELAATISSSVSDVDKFVDSQGLPRLTFDADGSSAALTDPRISGPRNALLDATDELHSLMLGPVGLLTTPSVSVEPTCQARSHECSAK